MADTSEMIDSDEKVKDLHKKRTSNEHLLKIKSELTIPFKKARYAWQIKKTNIEPYSENPESLENVNSPTGANENEPVRKSTVENTISKEDKQILSTECGIRSVAPCDNRHDDASNSGLHSKENCDTHPNAFSRVQTKTNKDEEVFRLDSVRPKVANAFCCFRGVTGLVTGSDEGSDDEYESHQLQQEVCRKVIRTCYSTSTDNKTTFIEAGYIPQPLRLQVDFQTALLDDNESSCNHSNGANYLWQKQEIACSIVDNVFNHTLEEMGMSPDSKINRLASQRLTLENHSIQAVIRQQGLQVLGKWDNLVDGHVEEVSVPMPAIHFPTNCINDCSCDNAMDVEFSKIEQDINDPMESICSPVENPSNDEKMCGRPEYVHKLSRNHLHKELGVNELWANKNERNACVDEPDNESERSYTDTGVNLQDMNSSMAINQGRLNSSSGRSVDDQEASENKCSVFTTSSDFKAKARGHGKALLPERALLTSICDGGNETSNVLDLAVTTAILSQGLTMTESDCSM